MFAYQKFHIRGSAVLATLWAGMASLSAQALPLHVEAFYAVNGATTVVPSQDSSTNVDILTFPNVDNVQVGIHTYGTLDSFAQFGNRTSGDISGPGSYDIEGIFRLELGDLGSSFSFDVIPGQVAANGAAGGFAALADFVRGTFTFDLNLDGTQVFNQVIGAVVNHDVATATSTALVGGGIGINLGVNCSSSLASGSANCSIAGGLNTLDLDALAGHGGPHSLIYTMTAIADGVVSDTSSCGFGNGGGGGEVAAAIIEGGGNNACGSIARSGDPIPEPRSLSLAALALASVVGARRRRAGPTV